MLLITHDLDALRPIAGRGADTYRSNEIDQAVAERCLLRLIGRMIDINFHLLRYRSRRHDVALICRSRVTFR